MKLRDIAILLAGLGVFVASVGIGYASWRWGRVADSVPGEIAATRVAVVGEIAGVRRDLNVLAEGTLDDLNIQAAALRRGTLTEVAEIRRMADRRLGDTLARMDVALAKAGAVLDTVDALRQDVKPVLDHAGSLAAQVDDAAPLFLNCEYNPDCAFNRFQGASKAFERAAINFGQMSQDARVALPGFVKNADSLVADSAATAANIKRLTTPKWYDRLIGYGLNGVLIYRNLNPVTNLTVTGATILSSRP